MKGRTVFAEPMMRRSVVLPKLADLLDLPAPHRFARLLGFGVRAETLRQRPAAHAGAINFEQMAAMNLRGGEAIGGRRTRTQELAQHHGLIVDVTRLAHDVTPA